MAQVHPQLFTQAIFAKAVEKYGVSLVIGKVQEVKLAGNKVTGVMVDGEVIAADTVVVAMGPWSGENSLVSSLTSISGLKAHSIVVRPKQPDAISPYALFLTYVSYPLFWFCTLTMVSNLCQNLSPSLNVALEQPLPQPPFASEFLVSWVSHCEIPELQNEIS
jgi:glycine/D-amino acid oxidase-like deaminating enzyme